MTRPARAATTTPTPVTTRRPWVYCRWPDEISLLEFRRGGRLPPQPPGFCGAGSSFISPGPRTGGRPARDKSPGSHPVRPGDDRPSGLRKPATEEAMGRLPERYGHHEPDPVSMSVETCPAAVQRLQPAGGPVHGCRRGFGGTSGKWCSTRSAGSDRRAAARHETISGNGVPTRPALVPRPRRGPVGPGARCRVERLFSLQSIMSAAPEPARPLTPSYPPVDAGPRGADRTPCG